MRPDALKALWKYAIDEDLSVQDALDRLIREHFGMEPYADEAAFSATAQTT